MVTPLTVTPAWLRVYLEQRNKNGLSETEARAAACSATELKGKDFARCVLSRTVLSVPVEGGASVLKRRGANPILSEHGKWRREHLGAWNAIYGRTPYYAHLMPEIEAVYAGSEGKSLEKFNSELLDVALGWLDFRAANEAGNRLDGVKAEARARIEENLSVFDLLFRLGKQAVFAI